MINPRRKAETISKVNYIDLKNTPRKRSGSLEKIIVHARGHD
jgi:hypothetical protein